MSLEPCPEVPENFFKFPRQFYGKTEFYTSFLFWLQNLHTNSDFYRLYITGKGILRSTTFVLNIFPKSDPKWAEINSLSSSFQEFREHNSFNTCLNRNYYYIPKKSG